VLHQTVGVMSVFSN